MRLGPGVALVLLGTFLCQGCRTCPPCTPCPACPLATAAVVEEEAPAGRWFVLRVIDGDTLVARFEGGDVERKETIRMLNVNTPERSQPGFVEATEALKELVRGGLIELEFEKPRVEKRDGFGRLLAYVIVDGINVNIEMVRQGWSKFYTKYGRGRLAAEFEATEFEARENRKGLWAEEEMSLK